MNYRLHLFDVSPFFGPPLVSDLRLVMEYFNEYSQTILENKTHVLRGANGLEVRVNIIIRPKVVFVRMETPDPASTPDDKDYIEVLKQFDVWHEDLIEKATQTAGIRGPGAAAINAPDMVIFYEPRIMWAEISKSERKDKGI